MRIEAGEHPFDRALDQLFIVDLFHIVAADLLEHVHELVERLVAIPFRLGESGSRSGNKGKRAESGGAFQEGGFHRVVES